MGSTLPLLDKDDWLLSRLPADVRPDRDVVLDTVVTAGPDIPREQWAAFYLDAIRALKPGLTEMIVHLGRDDAELQAVTVNERRAMAMVRSIESACRNARATRNRRQTARSSWIRSTDRRRSVWEPRIRIFT